MTPKANIAHLGWKYLQTDLKLDGFLPQVKTVLEKLGYDTHGVDVVAGLKFLIPVSTKEILNDEEFDRYI